MGQCRVNTLAKVCIVLGKTQLIQLVIAITIAFCKNWKLSH